MAIVFRNPGLIDLRAFKAFGVNVKDTDNPIGAFGTGAKMATAVLMRLGHKLTLYRGSDVYRFGVKPVSMRGKAFDFVTLTAPDGSEEELAYNTHLASHWEPWTAYRELASNALDEKGETFRLSRSVFNGAYKPRSDETAVVVEGPEIEKAYDIRDQIFLKGDPFIVTSDIAVHRGQNKWVYYRGIRVYELPRPSLFTYNLLNCPSGLSEDRVLKNPPELDLKVAELFGHCLDEGYLEAIAVAPKDTYEHHISTFWSVDPSEVFLSIYTKLRQGGRLTELSPIATTMYLRKHKHLPIPDPVPLNRVQQKQLDKAIAFCQSHGWTVTDYPMVIVPHARNGLMAWAQDNTIVLTLGVFAKGTKEVAQALFEEHLHLSTGLRDETREMQNHLMAELFGKAEMVSGEPL